jgi:hypothetical protein
MTTEMMPVPCVPTATKDKCCECGAEVWISPASREIAQKQNAPPICVLKKPNAKDDKIQPLSQGQIKEFLDGIAPERN